MSAVKTDHDILFFTTSYGPYIRLPFPRLDELKDLLKASGISYWVEENMNSFNGGPYLAYVHLPSNQSPEVVQSILERMRAEN